MEDQNKSEENSGRKFGEWKTGDACKSHAGMAKKWFDFMG